MEVVGFDHLADYAANIDNPKLLIKIISKYSLVYSRKKKRKEENMNIYLLNFALFGVDRIRSMMKKNNHTCCQLGGSK